jgi:hypothetical protein
MLMQHEAGRGIMRVQGGRAQGRPRAAGKRGGCGGQAGAAADDGDGEGGDVSAEVDTTGLDHMQAWAAREAAKRRAGGRKQAKSRRRAAAAADDAKAGKNPEVDMAYLDPI